MPDGSNTLLQTITESSDYSQMLIYKRNNKTKKAIAILDSLLEEVEQANDPQSMTFLLKQKYELQMISSNI